MESTDPASDVSGTLTDQLAPPTPSQFGCYTPKWANETDEHKYARHTRNAAVFIAVLLGVSAAVGIILGVVAVIDLGHTANALTPPAPSPTCYNANDPSTIGLPVC